MVLSRCSHVRRCDDQFYRYLGPLAQSRKPVCWWHAHIQSDREPGLVTVRLDDQTCYVV